jgi:GTP cyclohydrolase IA
MEDMKNSWQAVTESDVEEDCVEGGDLSPSERTESGAGSEGELKAREGEKLREMSDLVRKLIVQLGENPERDGLKRTPERYAKALQFLTSGYRQDPKKILNGAVFKVCYDQMVVVKDIEMFSLCEHHMLPFFGKCHVAYIASEKVIGLSKIARLVNLYARRLQIQERLTSQIATSIQESLSPQGVGVIIEARHLCMVMRGVEKQHSTAVTSAMLGVFRENKQTRDEFLSLVNSPKG